MSNDEPKNQLAVFDSLLDGLTQLAVNPATANSEFFDKTIQVLESVFQTDSAAVLVKGPNRSTFLIRGSKHQQSGLNELSLDFDSHDLGIATKRGWMVSSIVHSGEVWGWLVVQGVNNAGSAHQEVCDGIASVISEFIAHRKQATNDTESRYEQQLHQFTLNAHRSLDPTETAHHLANDARLLLACERVTIFALRRGRPQLLAISSVSKIERRSKLAQAMKSIAREVSKSGNAYFSDNERQSSQSSKDNSRVGQAIEKLRGESNLPFVVGIPLLTRPGSNSARHRSVGFLLAESTAEVDRFRFAKSLGPICSHASLAISNSERHHAIPLRSTLGFLAGLTGTSNLSRIAIVSTMLVAAIAALNLIQTDFNVRIRGELRPVAERNVFAPLNGVVDTIHVGHRDHVSANQTIIELRSIDLEIELEQTAKQKEQLAQLKDSKEITLAQASNATGDTDLASQLASEIRDIEFQIKSLDQKTHFLREKKKRLKIVAPIDGEITTWQANERLVNKPVERGEPILNIAMLDGDWQILFYVPERRVGYLLNRQNEIGGEEFELEFFLDSSPNKKFTTAISQIETTTFDHPSRGRVTRIRCAAPDGIPNKRMGASLSADVNCGRHSLWFVWTRELVDGLKRRFVW